MQFKPVLARLSRQFLFIISTLWRAGVVRPYISYIKLQLPVQTAMGAAMDGCAR